MINYIVRKSGNTVKDFNALENTVIDSNIEKLLISWEKKMHDHFIKFINIIDTMNGL